MNNEDSNARTAAEELKLAHQQMERCLVAAMDPKSQLSPGPRGWLMGVELFLRKALDSASSPLIMNDPELKPGKSPLGYDVNGMPEV